MSAGESAGAFAAAVLDAGAAEADVETALTRRPDAFAAAVRRRLDSPGGVETVSRVTRSLGPDIWAEPAVAWAVVDGLEPHRWDDDVGPHARAALEAIDDRWEIGTVLVPRLRDAGSRATVAQWYRYQTVPDISGPMNKKERIVPLTDAVVGALVDVVANDDAAPRARRDAAIALDQTENGHEGPALRLEDAAIDRLVSAGPDLSPMGSLAIGSLVFHHLVFDAAVPDRLEDLVLSMLDAVDADDPTIWTRALLTLDRTSWGSKEEVVEALSLDCRIDLVLTACRHTDENLPDGIDERLSFARVDALVTDEHIWRRFDDFLEAGWIDPSGPVRDTVIPQGPAKARKLIADAAEQSPERVTPALREAVLEEFGPETDSHTVRVIATIAETNPEYVASTASELESLAAGRGPVVSPAETALESLREADILDDGR
ncbi:hypothetical protein OB920_00345 [Halobacteria archaeon HArc-gm2]|nr:hypothetical protein [Halobacteria archaeon HArc-gm2]